MRLNLGCSTRNFSGFTNVDLFPPADIIADLTKPWPWEDNSVEDIRAWDIIEHLADKNFTMNEAFRVLQPGGKFDIIVPTTDGRGAWQDPGHVSFWNRNSFFYYQHGNAHLTRFAPMNGVRCAFRIAWELEELLADHVSKLHIILEAVK
jgi:SAM-dependent methyltransferase